MQSACEGLRQESDDFVTGTSDEVYLQYTAMRESRELQTKIV